MAVQTKTGNSGSGPADFTQAAAFTLAAIIAGLGIELFTAGSGVVVPDWPFNLVFLLVFSCLVIVTGVAFRQHPLVVWLGGIPLGLSLIIGLVLLSFVGGVLPQDTVVNGVLRNEHYPPDSLVLNLRFNGMFSSWPFAFVTMLFLFNLGLALVWKTIPFRVSNLQFMLFHGGFWIALSCGLLGNAQLERLIIPVYEGKASNVAYDRTTEQTVYLPFSIYLKDFQIEQYVPQFALYDPRQESVVETKSKLMPEIKRGVKAEWPGIGTVTVLDFFQDALPGADGVPVQVAEHKGVPFARVRIKEVGGTVSEQWISSGGPRLRPLFVPMGDYFLVMGEGAPKAFRSEVMMMADGGRQMAATLEVNKPVEFEGWKLYQVSYDEKAGRWSTLSMVEAIRDPWLPSVYVGFFMIMAGNTLYFWKGFKKMEAA